MIKKKLLFYNSPSKFTGGISILWRGMNILYLKSFIFNFFKTNNTLKNNILLYDSARTSILHILKFLNLKSRDQVIVSSFTCDAVTSAVINSGAKIVYVDIKKDLTMNDKNVLDAINSNTKVLILQNTFGRLGLSLNTLKRLKKKKIFVIEDNCLSNGSKLDNKFLGNYGDVSISSLEVSKTITLGWGGVLKINDLKFKKKIIKSYNSLCHVNIFSDIRILLQLYISLYFLKRPNFFGNLIWYFFYGTNIFRKSNYRGNLKIKKIGPFTKKFYLYLVPYFEKFYKKTNKNFIFLNKIIKNQKLICAIEEKKNERIVTPRIAILVNNRDEISKLAKKMKIEIGEWFKDCPPRLYLDKTTIYSNRNSAIISKKIINIPCYFSLTKNEIYKLKKLILNISLIENN